MSDNFGGPDEITKPIDVSQLQEELHRDKLAAVHSIKRALHTAASSAAQAGKMLDVVYDKISDALREIETINL